MKSRRGLIFNVLSLLSAVLLAVVLAAWAHAHVQITAYEALDHWVIDADNTAHSSRLLLVSTKYGPAAFHARFDTNRDHYVRHFRASLFRESTGGPAFARSRYFGPPRGRTVIPGSTQATWGFALNRWVDDNPLAGRTTYVVAAVPYWAMALALGVLPGWWLLRWRASRRRRPAGCCRHCGYDLRASPDRCPECGRPVTPASAVP